MALARRLHGPPNAPAVVLLHSIATSGELWAPQVPAWAERFRLVVVDLPGHGASARSADSPTLAGYAAALAGMLDDEGIGAAALVGLSLGGMVAQTYALAHPDRTTALVLAHTAARLPPQAADLWAERIAAVRAAGMASQVEPTLARWFTPGFAERSPLTLAWVARLILETDAGGFEDAVAAIAGLDTLEDLRALPVQALVVHGEVDTASPLAAAQAMADALPHGRLVALASGHLGNVEQPVAFTEAVGGFLARALG